MSFPRAVCPSAAVLSAVSPHVSSSTLRWFCPKYRNKIAHFSLPFRQQQLTQTVTDTKVCFDILGGNGNRTKLLIWQPLRMLSYAKDTESLYLLRDGEESFSCMWIPCPGGREGSSSTISPQVVL